MYKAKVVKIKLCYTVCFYYYITTSLKEYYAMSTECFCPPSAGHEGNINKLCFINNNLL